MSSVATDLLSLDMMLGHFPAMSPLQRGCVIVLHYCAGAESKVQITFTRLTPIDVLWEFQTYVERVEHTLRRRMAVGLSHLCNAGGLVCGQHYLRVLHMKFGSGVTLGFHLPRLHIFALKSSHTQALESITGGVIAGLCLTSSTKDCKFVAARVLVSTDRSETFTPM